MRSDTSKNCWLEMIKWMNDSLFLEAGWFWGEFEKNYGEDETCWTYFVRHQARDGVSRIGGATGNTI